MATQFELPRPENLRNLEDVGNWADSLASEIERAWNERNKFLELVELHAAPTKLYTGLTVLADGTNWDPGSGAGVYTYYGSSWHKLG